uniref:Disease resistance protein RGA3 n=1 Tax=Quercus lobata TaxID=97700 RepID=A0A7N2M2V1_QUELO
MELAYSIAASVIDKIGSLAYQEICSAWVISSDLKKLELTMSTIQAVLLDAEEKQVKNRGLSVWLGQLKDVFHDAMDVLDEFECEALRRQVVKMHGSTREKKIEGIRESLEELAKDRAQFQLEERFEDQRIGDRKREMTHSFVRDCDVIGRDDDKQKIIDLLMHPGDNCNVSVISIVGIGGLGKTTLSQWVYNDKRIAKHFDSRIWLCVSEDFNVLTLAKEILKSTGGGIKQNMNMDEVQVNLRSILKKKRFFIVLDDVWNENRNKWFSLKNLLIEGGQGSKILVTTRSHKVASTMAPGPIHDIEGLAENDCLSLFLRWAFNEGEEKQYPNLIKIGKKIAKKCRGVPLAMKTLGGLLYSKTEERDWISIRDNEIWKLEQKDDDILPALRLSYNRLPSYLKQCFAHCSLYPKDFRYSNLDLIQSWMANGLLQKSNKSAEELEDIGEQYIKDFLSRSLFQEFKDVAEHSFINKPLVETCISRFKQLRLLNLRYPRLEELPSSISTLKHLRYLNLRGNKQIKKLPESICNLQNLETLILRGCEELEELPRDIRKMISLRYLSITTKQTRFPTNGIECMCSLRKLYFDKCPGLESFPEGIQRLTALCFLGFQNCESLNSLPQGLKHLTALEVMLIQNCEKLNLMEGDDYPPSLQRLGIGRLPKLVALPLWLKGSANTLNFLTIFDCHNLVVLPEWLSDLNSLQKLMIRYCPRLSSLPEGVTHLTSLRELEIVRCPNLRRSCERNVGKDWPKIAHIPLVKLI